MGIEFYSQILSLNNARRCRHSKSQLAPNGANTFKRNATTKFTWRRQTFRPRKFGPLLTTFSASNLVFRSCLDVLCCACGLLPTAHQRSSRTPLHPSLTRGHEERQLGRLLAKVLATIVNASEKRSHSGRCWTGPVIHPEPRW